MNTLMAGVGEFDITPKDSQFLFGYPHVKRYSEGVHDPLISSALYLFDGENQVLFITNDIIFVTKEQSILARNRIEKSTGIPASNIMITATHTHSGPITANYLSNEADPVVPKADPAYIAHMLEGIVHAAERAYHSAVPAEAGLVIADGKGVGTNRRDPSGPADPEVPVLLARPAGGGDLIACMVLYSMHPTVLHEDSKLVSADFPGMTRKYLKENVLPKDCAFLYHTGPEGNQSPRHVTEGNTFAEAERLGEMLGKAVEKVIPEASFLKEVTVESNRTFTELPRRSFPDVKAAEAHLKNSVERLKHLRETSAPRQETRTAECDWFGAEETVTLAKAASSGKLDEYYALCMPAEVQLIRVGKWNFIGWPGEVFIEFSLELKKKCSDTFVINLANGEFQGYIVTEEAADEGGYEASNALFSYESGNVLVEKSIELIQNCT